MSVTFKAFLYERSWRGDPVEIRRFNVDQDVSTNYTYLLQKINQVFPSLTTNNVVVAWRDSDGDLVVISSDEELVEALSQFDGSIFRLYLLKKNTAGSTQTAPTTGGETAETTGESSTTSQPQGDQPQGQRQHYGVVCDGCSGPIHGTRYKCLVCDDYDLCSACEGKGVHVDHNMVTINDPGSYNPWGFHGWGGRGGHCGQRRGWGCQFRQGRPSCHGRRFGGHPGRFGCHQPPFGGHPLFGGFAPWWGGVSGCQGPQGASGGRPCGKTTGGETGKEQPAAGAEPMETEQPTEEQRKEYLRNIGGAVSSFLQPFGIKVDVDLVGEEKAEEKKADGDTSGKSTTSSGATPFPEVSGDVIEQALAQLKSMGYEDEGGWLTELVKAKGGDVGKVLDALHYTETD